MIKQKLSIAINRLMNDDNDRARSFLFSVTKTFYNDTLDEGYSWQDHATKLEFDEAYEYITKDRSTLINLIIEEELYISLGEKENTADLEELIARTESYDATYLNIIVKNRDIINTYV